MRRKGYKITYGKVRGKTRDSLSTWKGGGWDSLDRHAKLAYRCPPTPAAYGFENAGLRLVRRRRVSALELLSEVGPR